MVVRAIWLAVLNLRSVAEFRSYSAINGVFEPIHKQKHVGVTAGNNSFDVWPPSILIVNNPFWTATASSDNKDGGMRKQISGNTISRHTGITGLQ